MSGDGDLKFTAKLMLDFYLAQSDFEDALREAGFAGFGCIRGDNYDNSIEFDEVDNDLRMNEAAQKLVFKAGFSIAFVNHEDGWETHYRWTQPGEFKNDRGWRRKRTEEGGFLISYWPDGWLDRNWLKTGYVMVVADPLEPVDSDAPSSSEPSADP